MRFAFDPTDGDRSGSTSASTSSGAISRRTKTRRCWPRTTCAWASPGARRSEPPSRYATRSRQDDPGGRRRGHRHDGGRSEAAEPGYEVVLVEKEAQLGGFAGGSQERFPTAAAVHRAARRQRPRRQSSRVPPEGRRSLTSAKIARTSGQPGPVRRHVAANGEHDQRARVGAIVHGHRLEALRRHEARPPRLRPQPERHHQRRVREDGRGGPIVRPSDGKPARSVAFIQCAGSRDKNHLPYCSAACCLVTLKQALVRPRAESRSRSLRLLQGHAHAGPIRELLPRRSQEDPLNFFTKGEVAGGRSAAERHAAVSVDRHAARRADRRSRPTWWCWPRAWCRSPPTARPSARSTTPSRSARKGESETQRAEAAKSRRATEAPRGHRHPEPHLPPRTGPAGAALRLPRLALHLLPLRDAAHRHLSPPARARARWTRPTPRRRRGAAMKAIQCVELAARGQAVHPRAGDLSLPQLLPATLHAVQALHRGVPLRHARRRREGHAANPTPTAAAVAASAWAPARSASSRSRTTRWT